MTCDEITNIVTSFKSSSPGIDDLPMQLYKDHVSHLAVVIKYLCNLSLETGIFPKQLMIALITCLYKAGDPHRFDNYRAISILVAFSKILEKIVIVQLVEYFVANNLLSDCQFGYRSNVSTRDAMLSIVNSLYESFDEGHTTVSVFLDLSKAFDSLNRSILLKKLDYYGIQGKELDWFKSYFSERKQLVNCKGVRSEAMTTKFGVAQGSVAGPILFCIFVNDLVKCSNILKFVMYADDTCVYYSGADVNGNIGVMNRELMMVSNWMTSNGLTLNVNKCNYVLFRRKQRVFPELLDDIHIGGRKLDRLSSTKYLRLIFDENLTWSAHACNSLFTCAQFFQIQIN